MQNLPTAPAFSRRELFAIGGAMLATMASLNSQPAQSAPLRLGNAINVLDFLTAEQQVAVTNYTLTESIHVALKNAADQAVAQGKALYLPAGLWLVEANNSSLTGWLIAIREHQSLLIYGDGDATIIRRKATPTLAATSPIVWIQANTNINLAFQNLLFDGNEANCPFDSANLFSHEQSANVKFLTGSGIPNNITFDNVTMTGCVGDGFHANTPIQSLQVTNWRSYGRTRRPRADIQLSRIPLQATNVTNFIGDAFEMEPAETNREHVINLSNMLVRGALDLAGDEHKHGDGSEPNFANVNASNVVQLGQRGVGLPISNFFKVRGRFVNCSFVATKRIQRCNVTFKSSTFTVLGLKDQPQIADHVQIWQDQPDAFVEFEDVLFAHEAGVTTGHFVSPVVATSDANRTTRFINCKNLQQLDYFSRANRCGHMLVEGGQIHGKIAAIQIENGGGPDVNGQPYITTITLKDPANWKSALIQIGSVGGPIQIDMTGYFAAEKTPPSANTRELASPHITWLGGFTGAVTSNPNGRMRGLPGLLLRWAEAPAGENNEWRYKQGKTFAATIYEPL